MYIERIVYENVGPIHQVVLPFPFEESDTPKPMIFVGENGSGKSTILSNIVDALYEMAGRAFENAQQSSGKNGHQYYKSISPVQISVGKEYMYSYISFKGENACFYLCKAGKVEVEYVRQKTGFLEPNINWKEQENYKRTTIEKEVAEKVWNSNVICYFGPDRYERPAWMGEKYYQPEEYLHPTIRQRIAGQLDKPITVKNVTSANLSWLLDVIADSRPDITSDGGKLTITHVSTPDLLLLSRARDNLETILSKIIGEPVYFALDFRNRNMDRFKIVRKNDNTVVAPTLDSLSTGQIALFNLFSTIVRYADLNDINKSINLSEITGIVVIDEIELHLHTKLQKEVLPGLLKLFPKIQFVITTHAPLFLLGMRETFGEEHFDVFELPTVEKIDIERFSEFQKAYEYLKETETYQQAVKNAIAAIQPNNKAVIITEGSTDWKHLKAAYRKLQSNSKYQDIFESLDFEFLEYEPEESDKDVLYKLKMGNSVLCQICESMAILPQPVKYIFIADADDTQTNKKLSEQGKDYKNWGNNVYSLVLPIPPHRESTPAISIEHYYTDEEIKTEWVDPETEIAYRLYMGNEFDERGIAQQLDRFCERRNKCGNSSISIIEGASGEKVTSIKDNNGINYALPKSKFAQMILDQQAPFDNFNFDNFISVFKIIKSILAEN